ncbi:glycosyltransferase family 4 protein [Micromonospora chokoriensis]|uniref:Glycosyltransferase involved in cell wall bisynthesis n=1 Tax=Micromonospora chokoriensis TaxID=356851 RepID=A0A1C4VHQ3_9ACTN|nr:glycosyltransferase family 4 protein [Micromonospora chokoriensis]SCE83460.1 Glycosyltransferase involved in cell wall bisynthesis [Micromonospora chokoriensis]
MSVGSSPVAAAPTTDVPVVGRRIAVLNWKDPWHPDAGGAEVYAWQVARDLVTAGAQVTFLTARPRGQRGDEVRDGIRIVRIGGRWSIYPRVLGWLSRRRRQFDAVLDCQNGIPFFSPAVLPASVPVVCVIHHVHDRQFRLYFGPLVGRFGAWLEGPVARRVYRRCVTLAVSPSTATAVRERLGWTGPVVVVPNGADADDPPRGSRDVHPRLACVGRVTRHKRVDLVLDAVDHLRSERPDLRLDVVGGGPDVETIRRQVDERGLNGVVTVHGHLPSAERDALLAAAWLHVSGSWGEGWGLVVVEAAAAGLPTVAFDVDGLRDAVRPGRTGWLVEEGEQPARDLAAGLDRALDSVANPAEADRMANECRQWSAAFRWADTGRRVRAVLGDLLAPRAVPWASGDACLVVRTPDPNDLLARVAPLLPHTRHVALDQRSLWILVPGADPAAIRRVLRDVGVPEDAVTESRASRDELLTGVPVRQC